MSRLSSYRSSRSTRLLLWLGLGYAVLSLGHLATQEVRLLQKGAILGEERTAVEEKSRKLKEAIEAAKTPQGVERLARQNLGMAKTGEIPVRFVNPKAASGTL